MSQNYDNWERLVTAVLRREKDRYIALLDDLTSDCSTSLGGSSRCPSFRSSTSSVRDKPRDQVPMGYSDLMANHTDWKSLLPSDEDEVVWRSASLSFSIDKRTGKNCFMVGARELTISDKFYPASMMQMFDHSKSRFLEVGLLKDIFGFIIRGSIEIQRLSPKTTYGAYLVFGVKESSLSPDYLKGDNSKPSDDDVLSLELIVHFMSEVVTGFPAESANRSGSQHVVSSRADGWKEVELGSFYIDENANVHDEKQSAVVEVLLKVSPIPWWNGHLIVEGFQFRPWEAPAQPIDWKVLLKPDKYGTVWRSASLSFSSDEMTGKNCFMVGTRKLKIDNGSGNTTQRIYHINSRFSEVGLIEFEDNFPVIIEGGMAIQRLSPKTLYGAYLVFSFKASSEEDPEWSDEDVSLSNYKTPSLLLDNLDEEDPGSSDEDVSLSESRDHLLGSPSAETRVLFKTSRWLLVNLNEANYGSLDADVLSESFDYLLRLSITSTASGFPSKFGKPVPQRNTVMLDGVIREDGWMEVELGLFYIDEKQSGIVDVRLQLRRILDRNSHLVVEGFEFRPLAEPLQGLVEMAPKKTRFPKINFFNSKLFR